MKQVYTRLGSVIATWIETDYKGNIQVHWSSLAGENLGSFETARTRAIAEDKLHAITSQLLSNGYTYFGDYAKWRSMGGPIRGR